LHQEQHSIVCCFFFFSLSFTSQAKNTATIAFLES
jgi:hypothetical protein